MNQSKFRKVGHDILLFSIGVIIYSIGIHMFVSPANIAPGGAAGVALLVNHLCDAPVGITTMIINIPLLALSWLYLSRRFTIMTALSSAVCSLVLDFIIAPICPVYMGDRLLGSLFGGILVGSGMACIFLAGTTTGGTDIVGYLLQKKMPHISIGKALLFVDGIILILSIFVFGNLEAAFFGLICLYAQTKVIDSILYGADAGCLVIIVTYSATSIASRIIHEMARSATIITGRGAYSLAQVDVLLCTVRKPQFSQLKRIIYETDPGAFVMVTETTSVFGDGFKSFEDLT